MRREPQQPMPAAERKALRDRLEKKGHPLAQRNRVTGPTARTRREITAALIQLCRELPKGQG